jgi:multidrug efflux pump subunit AcrA (membrane-fusion protein)
MDRRGSSENGHDALWSFGRIKTGLQMLEDSMREQPQTRMVSAQELANYQTQLLNFEQMNNRRLQMARAEQDEASRVFSAETSVQPIHGPHALQAYQLALMRREAQNQGRIEVAQAQTMEALGESSNETPAHYGNNNDHTAAQKRKRDNNDEGRLNQPYNVSSIITSGGSNFHDIVNSTQDRGQAVSTSPDCNLLTYRILIAVAASL